jgi:hypothetical protein
MGTISPPFISSDLKPPRKQQLKLTEMQPCRSSAAHRISASAIIFVAALHSVLGQQWLALRCDPQASSSELASSTTLRQTALLPANSESTRERPSSLLHMPLTGCWLTCEQLPVAGIIVKAELALSDHIENVPRVAWGKVRPLFPHIWLVKFLYIFMCDCAFGGSFIGGEQTCLSD